jgi:hypothetical protein
MTELTQDVAFLSPAWFDRLRDEVLKLTRDLPADPDRRYAFAELYREAPADPVYGGLPPGYTLTIRGGDVSVTPGASLGPEQTDLHVELDYDALAGLVGLPTGPDLSGRSAELMAAGRYVVTRNGALPPFDMAALHDAICLCTKLPARAGA